MKKSEGEISKIVKQPVSFISKTNRYIQENQNNLEVEHPDLYLYNLPQEINLIVASCQELRITEDTLQQHMSFAATTKNDSVRRFVLFEQGFHF